MSAKVLGWATAVCGGLFVIALVNVVSESANVPVAEAKPPAKDLFGPAKVWKVELDLSAAEYPAMQPAVAAFPGAPPPKEKKDNKRPTVQNRFGTAFPWVEGNVAIDGTTLKKAGIRYAGDITYFVSGFRLKRPLHLQFDKSGDQKLNGLSSVQLHAMPLDPSRAREALAFAVFRSAGVPASRTAFAEVTLNVPGKYDKEYLGLYTAVESVDKQFLAAHFGADSGLLMTPFGMRGIDFLGDDWDAYKGKYFPQREPTMDEAKRVIEFAKFVNQASDADFKKKIDSFLDVDAFLRFQAANALTSNTQSFFALGHNYHLYLHPKTNKFHFIPDGLEFALANFMLIGTADQQMDLSLTKPYPGENKLPDRLMAMKDVNEKYRKLLKDLSASAFTKEALLKELAAIEKATKDVQEKEAKAVAARKEPPGGFGGPGGAGPQPPDLKTFAQKRTESVAAQLADKSKGFVPQQITFGPPKGGPKFGPGPFGKGNANPIDEKEFLATVTVPPEFDKTLYAAPPKVSYPVAIAAAPNGTIYVAVDEQGSLGRTPGGGRILRMIDKDGDGKVDEVTVFCKVDHPRGVLVRGNTVWVMHPPTLTVFHDDDGDGIADRSEVLVTGLTTDQITIRGGDHTTEGIRMGVDGWLYIGVGDYGIKLAKGKDGRTITQRGGGIVRVRPDGTELEVYCTGLRNPFDIAIDPFMNLFTRDNTNDGAGWDTRVSHLMQTAHYGYTQLFANFTDEIMPPLGVFGNGGATGGLFIQEPSWPAKYRNTLFTGDWGRSEVYRHELKPHGPTFDLKQELFMKMPRATGMDIDGSGRLYVASWRGGSAVGFEGPNIGFIARVTPKNHKPTPVPDFAKADRAGLIGLLTAPQSVTRLNAQSEILKRGRNPETTKALTALAADTSATLEGRVAAIFTLNQLDGKEAQASLINLAGDATVREFALRALTDRKQNLDGLDTKLFVAALADESPRVRAQALISLSRLNETSVAKSILPLTARPKGSTTPTRRPLQDQPDADRVIPHLAVRALVNLKASDACLEALDGPYAQGALWAMRYMHDTKTVDGLIKKLGAARSAELRRGILVTLIRLCNREADYTGSWWGIRPDNTGPYYDRVPWQMSKRIGNVITAAALDGDPDTLAFLKAELRRHKVSLPGLPGLTETVVAEKENPIVLPKADPKNPEQIGNMPYEVAVKRTLSAKGNAAKGELLFKAQSCIACHTTADGQLPKGPHLVEIGKRSKADELLESILRPSAKIAQGYETYLFELRDGKTVTGFVVGERAASILLRETNGVQREITRTDIESRAMLKISAMPEGLASNLTPAQLADLLAYLQSLEAR
jgi:putative membrane-bound dehydrogenase-like protein